MSTGKKGKKSKGKKITLQEFVHQPGGTGVTQVQVPTKFSWADECIDHDDDEPIGKIIELPTAPRASRLLQDDCVPSDPPYLAYLCNLPYDVEDADIDEFFQAFTLVTVRLPRDDDMGKSRGYGYVQFETREDLIDALSLADPMIRGRRIKIDLPNENDGQRRDNRRNNRYGNDNYGSGDRNTNWRDRQDGGFSGGRDFNDGGRRNNYGNRNRSDREPFSVDASEAGSWRTGDRPTYSPPPERKQYDRPPRSDRSDRDRFGGRRRNDYGGPQQQGEQRQQQQQQQQELPAERPKLNLKPRTLPLPELVFPKEEDVPVIFKNKTNGVEHHSAGSENDEIDGHEQKHSDEPEEDENNGDVSEEPPKASSPKPRGVSSAKVFGDAKPVDTAAKEREIEEKLMQRERDAKQKLDDEKKRQADDNEDEDSKDDAKVEGGDEDKDVKENPKPLEEVRSWRNKEGEEGRPRNKNYSPERDNRGPRRHDNKLKDRNFRDNRNNDRYGNRNNNRNFNQRRGDYRSDRGGHDSRGSHQNDRDHHQRVDRDRRDYNRDPKDIEERMPKYKPSEGPNFSVSNTFAGLGVDETEE